MLHIYAHRAGRGLAPENTLYACDIALQYDIDFIDFDIGMTKDGKLVVTHDLLLNPTITRDISGNYIAEEVPVYALTYKQLCQYNVGTIKSDTQYASFFPEQKKVEEARIPLLKDAIQCVLSKAKKDIGFQIEIKTNPLKPHLTATPDQFTDALFSLLKEFQIIERTEVQAFDYRCLLSLQQRNSQIKTTYLTPHEDNRAQPLLWTAGHDVKNFGNSMAKMIKNLGGSCWGPCQSTLTKEQIVEAQELGLKVVPWGYPEKEGTEFNRCKILKLIEWGVDGIITDRPDALKQLLCEWHQR